MKPRHHRWQTPRSTHPARITGRAGSRGFAALALLLWTFAVQAAAPVSVSATATTHAQTRTATTVQALLRDFPVSYEVSHNGFQLGIATRTLKQTGPDTLVFESIAKPTGLAALFVSDHIIERSTIKVVGQQLRPLHYSYRKTGGKHERSYTLQFDWTGHRITGSASKKPLPLLHASQDLLSFQLALMLELQQGKRSFSFAIADKKKLRNYHFQVTGEERLDTAIGTLSTVKLVHPDRDGEGRFEFWLAKRYGYLPVRIERRDHDGDLTRMTLHSLRGQQRVRFEDDELN